ncbi:MAG: bifunctional folylpolyglutamate synthase/dihydrofolate synthase [Chloroflexi bacterium]|nr:bifunctional folylpolyglutamate synthase/dihydrofolate synthase [Chloroflexota bacterium]
MLTYREALTAIFRRTDYERGDRPPYAERVWRLGRMEELLAQLGNPHRAYRSVHIAGTKGKGSTTAMIESILRAAGYKTGMYTSPHLHTFRERIQIEGRLISEEEVSELMESMVPLLEARPEVTVFEIMTALAMWLYARREVDFGVFEVGLGGRLDSTNVLQPEVAVITSISLDHMNVLGNTLSAIAREKAGIIKTGTPVVTSPQKAEAMAVIEATTAERQAPLTAVGRDWQWRFLGADLQGQRLAVYRASQADAPEYPELFLPLLGRHQLENACTALAAIEVLRERGIFIPATAIREGLAQTRWPGRMEVLGQGPLVMVDGAHNSDSMQRLLEALPEYLNYRRILALFGAGQTHDYAGMLALLAPQVDGLYACQAPHPKATPTETIAEAAERHGGKVLGRGSVGEMLDAALAEAGPDDLVLITGSLFVVAEARRAWFAARGVTLPADPPGVY